MQLFTFIALALINSKRDLMLFVWVITLSVALLGVKGGLYTLRGGGEGLVLGPGGFIGDNNQFAVAVIITIPLVYFLFTQTANRWVRLGLVATMAFCALSALGSHSRGALVAIAGTAAFLWLKSKHRFAVGAAIVVLAPLMFAFMPERWEARMRTSINYEEDGSAMGRIYTWQTLTKIANDRPLVGGGFAAYESPTYLLYHTAPDVPRSAHNVYFQVLGEHGYVALGLFLLIWFFTWRDAAWIVRSTRGREDLKWAHSLASMIQVSMVAYLVGGLFVNIAYWDMPYFLLVAVVVARSIAQEQMERQPARPAEQSQPHPA